MFLQIITVARGDKNEEICYSYYNCVIIDLF